MRNNVGAGKERRYPFKMSRLYVNIATVILAVFMALVTLPEPLLVLLFLVLTAVISAATFFLKIRPVVGIRKMGDQRKDPQSIGRRELYILLLVVIAIILLPFLLFLSAAGLPTYTWFAVLASFAAGIGISEVLFYVYCKRMM